VAAHILFVTGKGGTGKSSVATSLAQLATSRGRAVVLLRMRTATGEDAPATEQADDSIARDRAMDRIRLPRLREVSLDDQRDLEQFLLRVLPLGFLARRLLDSRTFTAVAAAAPGLRDLVRLTGIAALAASPELRRGGLVVVDAPATGHSVPLLQSPAQVLELAPIGPVAREARRTRRLIADPQRFTPVLVTTPEELAITEVLSLHRQILGAGLPAPRIVVNGLWPAHLEKSWAERLVASGASADAALHWRRRQRQMELVEGLEQAIGTCPRIGFSFRDGALPEHDVESLLTELTREAA